MWRRLCDLAPALLCGVLGACSPAGHDAHGEHGASAGGHVHRAPHGGVLVPLGDHVANLEFVLDRRWGRLDAYVLDAHAENGVRVAQTSLACAIAFENESVEIELAAQANALSGETPGNSSQFAATHVGFGLDAGFAGRVRELQVRGATYRDVPFTLPPRALER